MFQKFNTDTLISRFVKCLLSKEYQPMLDCVDIGSIIIKDCLYIYDHFIIKCVETGKLYISEKEKDSLWPSDTLYPSVILYPGSGEAPARFMVVSHYDESIADRNTIYKYNSNVHWYDSETHKQLGNYLRYLKDRTSINMLPYYNCFSSKELEDVYLYQSNKNLLYPSNFLFPEYTLFPQSDKIDTKYTYFLGNLQTHRVYAVPVKFDRTYTIALDSVTPIQLRCIVYGKSGMVKMNDPKYNYYSDLLEYTYQERAYSRFHEPFTFNIQTVDKRLYQQQSNLYLIIQVPKTVTTSIVVLEGDYTLKNHIKTNTEHRRDYFSSLTNLSLLRSNTHESYAFSDRLIEYLLWNVISPRDRISGNIGRAQTTINDLDSYYHELVTHGQISYNVWDDNIRNAVARLLTTAMDDIFVEDQDGYINKDTEKILEYLKSKAVS